MFSALSFITALACTAALAQTPATTPAPATAATPAPSSEIPAKREFPLDSKVNPCEDFHKFVCSNVEASFKLRDDRSMHDFAFSDSRERLLVIQKDYMKELPKEKNLDPRTAQVRDFYMSCMDEKGKAASEKHEVRELTKKVDALKTSKDLIAFANKELPSSLGEFVDIGSTPNQDDAKKIDVHMAANLMLLPDHKYYANPELTASAEKLLTLFFKKIYPHISDADALKRAQNIVALQQDFIKTYPVASVRRQRYSEKHESDQAGLLKKYPNLQLDQLFASVPKTSIVEAPVYEGLDYINNNINTLPLRTWKDMYLVKNLWDQLDDGYPDFFKQKFEFTRKFFGGPEKRPERNERCTTASEHHFMKEFDAALVDKVFPNFDEKKVQDLAGRIRASILDGLKNNDWLSPEGKAGAIAKIQNARLQLVKPHTDKEWDFIPLRKYSKTDEMKNLHTYGEAQWEKTMKELREPANQDAWGMGPLTVNAYYSENENKFVMPIGILQYPFYDKDGDMTENLGAVGAVMGHELGHSIDDQGSKYDYTGKLTKWMPEKDSKEFDRRSQKLVQQFNKIGHDGSLTLGENSADLVGLTFAYHAAFPDGKGSKEDKQRFFEAFGRLWCGVTRPEFEQLQRKTDPHAAPWARINEQVKHQPAFAEAFSCKVGDKMNLPDKERLKIW